MPFGLTRDEFYSDGPARFGEAYFRELSEECRQVRLDTDLMVAGFDGNDPAQPHIFIASKDSAACTTCSDLGFCAIGVGASAAVSPLYMYPDWMEGNVNEIVYRLCEAAFVAKTSPFVGRVLVVDVLLADRRHSTFVVEDERNPIRVAWKRMRDRPVPKPALAHIEKQIAKNLMPQETLA